MVSFGVFVQLGIAGLGDGVKYCVADLIRLAVGNVSGV